MCHDEASSTSGELWDLETEAREIAPNVEGIHEIQLQIEISK